jgi:Fic family protein
MERGDTRQPHSGRGDAVSVMLEERIRGEFLEMPGLRLTPQQASRLWAVDRATSEVVLNRLASTGFLSRTREGAYLRSSAA